MSPRWLQMLAVTLALAPAAMAQTGVLDVAWNASPDPGVVAYRVYFGTSSTSLGTFVEVPAPQTSTQIAGLLPFTFYFVEVSAVRASGCESDRSLQASGRTTNPGPECDSVTLPVPIAQGDQDRGLTIAGSGFEPGIGVRFVQPPLADLPLAIQSLTLSGTTAIALVLDAAADTPTGPVTIRLQNTDPGQAATTCADGFDVDFDSSRADVDGSGRVDGLDATLVSIIFGSFLRVCSLDSPAAAGSRCDTEDDCGGTVGVTTLCTDRACNAGANAGLACNDDGDCLGGSSPCVPSPYNPAADLSADGLVDGEDVSLQGAVFGEDVP